MLVGIALLFFSRFRSLACYVLFGSTLGLVMSILFWFALLLVVSKLLDGTKLKWLVGIAFVGFPIGGLVGIASGSLLAYKLNRRLGWSVKAN